MMGKGKIKDFLIAPKDETVNSIIVSNMSPEAVEGTAGMVGAFCGIENGHSRSKLFYIDGRNSRKFRGIYVECLLDNSEEK